MQIIETTEHNTTETNECLMKKELICILMN